MTLTKTQPFLRWAGEKKWLVKYIKSLIPSFGFNNYHEPFLGGGAIFFKLQPKSSYLSDVNRELIGTYLQIKNNVEEVDSYLKKFMKKKVLNKLKYLFNEYWELEINTIKTACQDRAGKKNAKNYKEGIKKTNVQWTEMFNINDYKSIIEKYWTKQPIDIGQGIGSKAKRIKWISYFNSYRNLWVHEGTKEKRLNKEEVEFLRKLYFYFYPDQITEV